MAERDQDDMRIDATNKLLNARFDALDKQNQPKRGPGRPKKPETDSGSAKIWHEAMMVIMSNYQVKSAAQLDICAKLAEDYLKLYNERFK